MSAAGKGVQERGGATPAGTVESRIMRMIHGLLRFGNVVDIDATGKVRVELDSDDGQVLVTPWINWCSRLSGADRSSDQPDLGTQVLLGCPDGNIQLAVVLATLRSAAAPYPEVDPNNRSTFYRILEGSGYWHAAESRRASGDVMPATKKANAEQPLNVYPPKEKVLQPSAEIAGILEYFYSNVIRPELMAVMEQVSLATGAGGSAHNAVAAVATTNGSAVLKTQAAVRGAGDATSDHDVLVGESDYNTEGNPNKDAPELGSGGTAADNTRVKSVAGKAIKRVLIDGAGASELQVTLTNAPKAVIKLGGDQTIMMDGKLMQMDSPEVILNTNYTKIVGETLVDGNLRCTGEVSDKVRPMTGDRDIHNLHDHNETGKVTQPANQKQ
ncbi:hypothetical protein H10PHJ05_40 [Aeromonas phage HJ05]|nr:hypothetical protein H10PHJ05_40 [Aeromonas phage HJ05]